MIDLRPWSVDDLWIVERFLSDPAMMAHLGGPQGREQILDAHRQFLETAASGTGAMFKVVLGPESSVVGNIGFWDKTWRDELVYETGWMTLPEYQGRGLAGEALAMLAGRLKRDHARRFLHAFPSIANVPSNALCRRGSSTLASASSSTRQGTPCDATTGASTWMSWAALPHRADPADEHSSKQEEQDHAGERDPVAEARWAVISVTRTNRR